MICDDNEPLPPLVFPDTPAPRPASPAPPRAAPLIFDETPMASTPAPSASKVAPLDFGSVPSAAPSVVKPVSKPEAPVAAFDFGSVPSPAPKPKATPAPIQAPAPLDFSSVPSPKPRPVAAPAPARPSTPSGAPTPAFGVARSQDETRAIENARTQFADLFARHGQTITNAIQQLLPFELSQLEHYGRTALDAQAQAIHGIAQITRDFNLLNAPALIQAALDDARPAKGVIDRLRGQGKVNTAQFRVQAEALRVQIGNFLPRIEQVRAGLKAEGERLPVLLAALSCAASAVDTERDAAIGMAVANRRTVLTQAVQQSQVLSPQVDEMRRQAVEQQGALTNFLQVTLPALELAAAQGR